MTRIPAAWKSRVPEGGTGYWRVERFTIEHDDLECLRIRLSGRVSPAPGVYTRLVKGGGCVVMSDTAAEYLDHLEAIGRVRRAEIGSRVLIHGLGLGCFLSMVLAERGVAQVDVVEKSQDVIDLVAGPFRRDPRVRIWHDDCLTRVWPRNARWNVVWHDIWDSICADNLVEMKKLHHRFGHRCDWQGSWCRDECEEQR